MVTAQKKSDHPIPFNKEVLKWAREFSHYSIEQSAKKAGTNIAKILKWESGEAMPTVKQARKLAELYNRPFLEFLGTSIPKIHLPALIPDFRLYRDAESEANKHELTLIQAWAESYRKNALDLYEINGLEVPRFPFPEGITINSDPEDLALRMRNLLEFPISEQLGIKAIDRDKLPNILREKFEKAGILTLKRPSLTSFGARGLCFAVFPLPTIVFGNEMPTAQAFTLAHELGHILLNSTAIIGQYIHSNTASNNVRLTEEWCNKFSAAFLVPRNILSSYISKPSSPQNSIDDETLNHLARLFRVSPHAMLIRLVHLNYVTASYYWDFKRDQFLDMERSFKSNGRSKYYGSRYKTSLGDLYTGLVIEAWNNGRITNHNAGEFMGIKNLRHLSDIKSNYLAK